MLICGLCQICSGFIKKKTEKIWKKFILRIRHEMSFYSSHDLGGQCFLKIQNSHFPLCQFLSKKSAAPYAALWACFFPFWGVKMSQLNMMVPDVLLWDIATCFLLGVPNTTSTINKSFSCKSLWLVFLLHPWLDLKSMVVSPATCPEVLFTHL